MKAVPTNDTIVAIATPPGSGAIAVIRLSGPAALVVADRAFKGRTSLAGVPGSTVHHGFIVNGAGERVDEVLATVFRAPHSYTGEDLVEVGCHGGRDVSSRVLVALVEAGGRNAGPGEFTRRAFLNGKMDLSQAEAVMGLIAAESRAAGRVSLAQLEGRLGRRVSELRRSLLDLCALLELELDFVEEGLTLLARPEIELRLKATAGEIECMSATYSSGRLLRDGAGVVLLGRPNAGKSSLFNALLREARAIVTPHPGTTRDLLEESLVLRGIPIRLHDTAGLRDSQEPAEMEGVRRGISAATGADILIVVIDPEDVPELNEITSLRGRITPGQKVIWAINKQDKWKTGAGPIFTGAQEGEQIVPISALTGAGLHDLEEALISSVSTGEIPIESITITSERHFKALKDSLRCLDSALEAHQGGLSNEFISVDVKEAADLLAEITGEITSDEVLNSIFERFCIGK